MPINFEEKIIDGVLTLNANDCEDIYESYKDSNNFNKSKVLLSLKDSIDDSKVTKIQISSLWENNHLNFLQLIFSSDPSTRVIGVKKVKLALLESAANKFLDENYQNYYQNIFSTIGHAASGDKAPEIEVVVALENGTEVQILDDEGNTKEINQAQAPESQPGISSITSDQNTNTPSGTVDTPDTSTLVDQTSNETPDQNTTPPQETKPKSFFTRVTSAARKLFGITEKRQTTAVPPSIPQSGTVDTPSTSTLVDQTSNENTAEDATREAVPTPVIDSSIPSDQNVGTTDAKKTVVDQPTSQGEVPATASEVPAQRRGEHKGEQNINDDSSIDSSDSEIKPNAKSDPKEAPSDKQQAKVENPKPTQSHANVTITDELQNFYQNIKDGEISDFVKTLSGGQKLVIHSTLAMNETSSPTLTSRKIDDFNIAVIKDKSAEATSDNNDTKEKIFTAIKSAQNAVNKFLQEKGSTKLDNHIIGAIITVAAINKGVGSKDEKFDSFKNCFKENFPNEHKFFTKNRKTEEEFFEAAKKFSAFFQEDSKKLGLLTGNQNASKIVGARLKRLDPAIGLEFAQKADLLPTESKESFVQNYLNAVDKINSQETTPSTSPMPNKLRSHQSETPGQIM